MKLKTRLKCDGLVNNPVWSCSGCIVCVETAKLQVFGFERKRAIMRNYRFDTRGPNQPSFYVFNHRADMPNREESAFYYYDTPQEAIGLFRYLLIEHPEWHLTLGVHKDYARRADIIEHAGGITILVDDFKLTNPWNNDPAVAAAAEEAAKRLSITWQVDRDLVDVRILVPCEPKSNGLNPFFDDKSLLPDRLGDPLSSIREACLEGEGWIPIEELKERAQSCWRDVSACPKVTSLLIAYQVDGNGFGASTSVTPAEFEILRQRYEAEQRRERPESLDEARLKARQRAASKNAARNYSEISSSIKRGDASRFR